MPLSYVTAYADIEVMNAKDFKAKTPVYDKALFKVFNKETLNCAP